MTEEILTSSKLLIMESNYKNFGQDLKILYSESKKIIEDFENEWGINLKLLMTWGAALGGIMLPMKLWIEEKYPKLSYEQHILILLGSIIGIYYDNEFVINEIINKVKNEDLLNQFKQSIIKAQSLNNSLNKLLDEMKIIGDDYVDSLSLAFFLPILQDVKNIISPDNLETIGDEMVNSGVILTSKSKTKFFLRKLMEMAK